MCIIEWINTYQGFFMCLLTLVYVVATVCILRSNQRSAKAAAIANKQQYSLELLDKRLASYYRLNEWISIAKNSLIQPSTLAPSIAFGALLFNNPKNEALISINDQIDSINSQLQSVDTPDDEHKRLTKLHAQLCEKRFLMRLAELDVELGLINQVELLFPTIDYNPVKKFAEAFLDAAVDISNIERIERLKKVTQQVIDAKILDSLWSVLKMSEPQ